MASILSLLFLALSFSMGSLLTFDLLITFANHNHHNSLIFVAVHTFIFLLVPVTFISAIILLLFRVAKLQSAFFINHFTRLTQVLVSSTLLVGVPLIVHVIFTEEIMPDTLNIMLIGTAAAAVVVTTVCKNSPFKRFFNSAGQAGQTVGSFIPAFVTLCISTSTFLFFSYQNHANPLVPIPIQLFLLFLNCLNFLLAMVLLFLCISVPTEGSQSSIPVVLVEAVLAMSFTTTGIIGFYMVVAPLFKIM